MELASIWSNNVKTNTLTQDVNGSLMHILRYKVDRKSEPAYQGIHWTFSNCWSHWIEKIKSSIKVPQLLCCDFMCMTIATAYSVCASKVKFELECLYLIISRHLFFQNYHFIQSFAPFSVCHNFLYISRLLNNWSWQLIYQIKTLLENIVHIQNLLTQMWCHQISESDVMCEIATF